MGAGGWNVASMMPALNPRDWIFELNPWGPTLVTQKWQLFVVHWIDTMENCFKSLLHANFLHHWAFGVPMAMCGPTKLAHIVGN